MVIAHNLEASATNRQLGITSKALARSSEKLASGYRINRAADDVAGLGISEEMRAQVRGLNRSLDNVDDAISYCQVADGAMQELEDIIHHMRELSIQAANDTNTSADRQTIQREVTQLVKEIDHITNDTEFNTIKIFGDDNIGIQVGSNANDVVEIRQPQMGVLALFDDFNPDVTTFDTAQQTIESCTYAIEKLNAERAYVGAVTNRFSSAFDANDNTSENLQSAESLLRDVNMADEMVEYSSRSILQQAGQAMLSQANSSKDGIMTLLRG